MLEGGNDRVDQIGYYQGSERWGSVSHRGTDHQDDPKGKDPSGEKRGQQSIHQMMIDYYYQ